ncbi:MAG: DNA primase [Armatimonadetes bacterium]|nr:DNA primase [Armatimonadota bacterium]
MEDQEKEAIRQRTDIVELVSAYTPLKKTGNRWKGCCPFHSEKTPSFTVDPERGRWHCFGACSTGGDIFTFLERAENLSFMEAAERLAAKAGITLSRKGATPAEREAADRSRTERDRVFNANALAARFFQTVLRKAPLAFEYAYQKRKLSSQTLDDFAVGYAPDEWEALSRYLHGQGVFLEDAERAGLLTRRGDGSAYDRFRARLIFPIVDVQERVVAFGGRILVPAENAPKYLNSPETPVFSKSKTLYALNRARKTIAEKDQAVIVEGYMDVVACHQAGFTNVIATLGTSLTDEHVRLLGRYTKNVVLSFDADDAGIRAALRSAELFTAAGANAFSLKVLNLPSGEDPDSLVTAGNTGAFQRAIDEAMSVSEFHLQAILKRHDTQNPAGREQYMREALGIIAEVRGAMEQDRLIQKIARYHPSWERGSVHVEESLRAELRRLRFGGAAQADAQQPERGGYTPRPQNQSGGNSGGYPARQNTQGRGGGFAQTFRQWNAPPPEPPPTIAPEATADAKAERTVLLALFHPEWTQIVQNRVRPAFFGDARATALVERALPALLAGHSPASAVNGATESSAELATFADKLLLSDADEPLNLQAIEDCLLFLAERQGKRQARNLSQQIEESSFAQKQNKDISTEAGKTPAADEERLRQWQQTMETLKRARTGGADGKPG